MSYSKKTKKELIHELEILRKQIDNIEPKNEKLKEAEYKYRNLFDYSPEGIIIVKDRIILDANHAFLSMLHYQKSEIVGQSTRILYSTDEYFERVGEEVYGSIQQSGTSFGEYNLSTKEGSSLKVEMYFSFLKDDTLQVIIRDVRYRAMLEEERRKNTEKLKELTNASFEGIVFHLNGIIYEVNNQILDLTGYERSDLLGKPVLDFIAEESREKVFTAISSGYEEVYEAYITRKNGTKFPAELRGKKIIHQDKTARVAVVRDISDRKEAQKKITRSEEKYRTLFEKSADAQLIIDDNKFVDYNDAAVTMLRYGNKDELLDTHPSELSPPFQPDGRHSYEKAIEMMEIAFKKGSHRFEWIHKRADGELFPVEVLLTSIPSDEREILYVIWRDITEVKLASQELRASEAKYKHLLDNIPLKVFFKDKDCVYLAVNPSFARDRNIPPSQFFGKTDFELFPPDVAERYREDDLAVMRGGKTVESEKKYQHEDQVYTINSIKVPVRDESGNIYGILGIIWDISERKRAEENLKKSLEINKIAEDIANMGSWEWDIESNSVNYSDNALKLFEMEKEGFDGKLESIFDYVHADDRLLLQKNLEKMVLEKKPLQYEFRVKSDNGNDKVVAGTNKLYIDANGNVKRLVGIVSDITKQRKSEYMLRQQSLMVDTITDAIIITDPGGAITDWNNGAEKMFGYSRDEAIGETQTIILRPDDAENLTQEILSALKEYQKWNGEINFVRKDRSTGFCETVVVPMLDKDFEVIATIGINREISNRKRVENELKLSKKRLQALLNLSQTKTREEEELTHHALEEAVVFTNSEIGYLHFFHEDRKALELFAWSDSTMELCTAEKTPHYPLSEAGVWADCVRLRKPVIHNDYPNMIEKQGYPEGHFPVLRHMSVPIIDDDKIIAVAGVGNKAEPYDDNDANQLSLFMNNMWRILKHKRDEKELERLNKELQRSNNELEQFAYITSHDLQEPLRSIVGFLQLLESRYAENLDEKGQHFIGRSIAASKRMSDMIQSILLYSRVGRSSEPLEEFELNDAVDDALANLHKKLDESNVKIERKKLPLIRGNRVLISHLLQNLIDNGIKFNKSDQPQINIAAEENQKFWIISVSDNGIGFEDKFKNRIFEIFQRLHTITEYSGTGIGLALCKKIVERHNGNINVESKPGIGSTFEILLAKELE